MRLTARGLYTGLVTVDPTKCNCAITFSLVPHIQLQNTQSHSLERRYNCIQL